MTRAEFHKFITLMLAALDRTPDERQQVTRCWLVASNIHWPVVARMAATAASRVDGIKPVEGPAKSLLAPVVYQWMRKDERRRKECIAAAKERALKVAV